MAAESMGVLNRVYRLDIRHKANQVLNQTSYRYTFNVDVITLLELTGLGIMVNDFIYM